MAKEKDEAIDVAEDAANEVSSSKKDSAERTAFKEIIEAYKKQNPVKYALKKDELQRKLDAIK